MNLDRLVTLLLNERNTHSLYLRAISLFEFQTAIFYPRSFSRLIAIDEDARAPTRTLRTACIFAAIKFLEDIQTKSCATTQQAAVSIRKLSEDQNYREIFDNVILKNGGWPRIRHSRSASSFDAAIDERRKQALPAAKIIDFSYRHSTHHPDSMRAARITAAKYVVRTSSSYESKMAKATMYKWWTQYRPTAAFLYLLLIQEFPLMPAKVGSKKFCDNLLQQTNDVVTLRHFFCAYQKVSELLRARCGYEFDVLNQNLNCPSTPLKADPLFQDVERQFEKSKTVAGN
jgi:hypothetical protein